MYDLKEERTEKGNLQFQLFTAAFHNGGLFQHEVGQNILFHALLAATNFAL